MLRVLVVDDNRDAVDGMIMLMELLGYSASASHSGAEALDLIPHYQPHVVLLDIDMPHMNGWETARRIRDLPDGRHIALIALTGHGNLRDKLKSQEAGFDHHLLKPVDTDVLERFLDATDRMRTR